MAIFRDMINRCAVLVICAFSTINVFSQVETVVQLPSPSDTNLFTLTELPRPNSGTYSFEEADKHKNEIYDMSLTAKYTNWKNPTSGGAIHINKNDEIEVYQFTFGIWIGYDTLSTGEVASMIKPAPKDTTAIVQAKDLNQYVGGVGFGNPASVLITTEYDPKKSQALRAILNEVYEPATQIYYLKNKRL